MGLVYDIVVVPSVYEVGEVTGYDVTLHLNFRLAAILVIDEN